MEKIRKDLKRLTWVIVVVAVGLLAALTTLVISIF